jgi:hypothetical protein
VNKISAAVPVLSFLVLGACQMLQSSDPNSLGFSIPNGSKLVLTRSIHIDHGNTHATIQFGKVVDDKDRKDYEVNCGIDFKSFGPREIRPETYSITRTEDGFNWVSEPSIMRFYTEVYLASKQTDVIKMVCQQYGDQTDHNFTVAEMQAALGDLLQIKYPEPAQ